MFEDDDEEKAGPRAVITISGIPRDADPVRMLRVVEDVTESVYDKLDSIEIGIAMGAPDITLRDMEMSQEDRTTMREGSQLLGTDVHMLMKAQVAGQLIMAATLIIDDLGSEHRWESKSEEEKEEIIAHNRERAEEWNRRGIQEMQNKRTTEIRQAFDIANTWASEPDLTPMERCHGVAHELYKIYGVDAKPVRWDGDKEVIPDIIKEAYPINAGQAYAQHYESQLADQIKSRSIRSAKELFGG